MTNCYRPRLALNEQSIWAGPPTQPVTHPFSPSQWAGIDCSGFVQRCAVLHTSMPKLNTSRYLWNGAGQSPDSAVGTSGLISNYTIEIGLWGAGSTYNRMVPGDVIIKPGHVAIVNFVAGERGNIDNNSTYCRNSKNIYLVQAISQGSDRSNFYPDGRVDGRVTDTWTWQKMGTKAQKGYHARRLLP